MSKKPFSVKSLLSLPNEQLSQIIKKITSARHYDLVNFWFDTLEALPQRERDGVFDKVHPLVLESLNYSYDLGMIFEIFSPVEWPKLFLKLAPAIDKLITTRSDVYNLLNILDEHDRLMFFDLFVEHRKQARLSDFFTTDYPS